jgi:hypothetical protein
MRYRPAILVALLSLAILGITTQRQDHAVAVAVAAVPSVTGSKVVVVGDMVPDPGTGVSLTHAQNVARRGIAEAAAAYGFVGDEQYERGQLALYQNVFDLVWGPVKPKSFAATGNHEYGNGTNSGWASTGGGFYDYFGSQALSGGKSYFSFNVNHSNGTHTHFVILNSACGSYSGSTWTTPSCDRYGAMNNWLRQDLNADTARCEVVLWHEPAFATPAPWPGRVAMRTPWWVAEYRGVDLFMAGHNHVYEYFYPQTYQGVRSFTAGTRQLIIGTGGRSLIPFRGTVQPNSLFRDASHYGYLRLTLTGTGITTEFISEAGALIDRHAFGCRAQTRS